MHCNVFTKTLSHYTVLDNCTVNNWLFSQHGRLSRFGVYSCNLTTPISTTSHFIMQAVPQELSTKTDFTTEQIWVQLLVQLQRCKISLIVTTVWNLHKSISHNYICKNSGRLYSCSTSCILLPILQTNEQKKTTCNIVAVPCRLGYQLTILDYSEMALQCIRSLSAATYHTWSAVCSRGKKFMAN